MKKTYILQEKQSSYICDTWFDKYYSDDLDFLKNMKNILEKKYSIVMRIIEVCYE